MATIGSAQLDKAVFEFFDAVRSYDAKRAAAVLAPDADFESPWSAGKLTGRDVIESHLKSFLGDPKTRPTFTITDIRGGGSVVHLAINVSGRLGKEGRPMTMDALCLKHQLHHVAIRPKAAH